MLHYLLLFASLLTALSSHASLVEDSLTQEAPHYFYPNLHAISQNALEYLAPTITPSQRLISEKAQATLTHTFLQRYFSPWRSHDHFASIEQIKQQQITVCEALSHQTWWGANHYPVPPVELEAIKQNLDLAHFPNQQTPGITLQGSDLKQLPTSLLFLGEPGAAGEGYPFDRNQESWVMSNTPVLILHETRDRSWRLVLLGHTFGWLPTQQVAIVAANFIQQWQHPQTGHATITALKTALVTPTAHFITEAQLSSLHPLVAEHPDHWILYAANSDAEGKAILQPVTVLKSVASRFPLPLIPLQLASLINQLMGLPYSWGGLSALYDCSSTLVTLFQPFGIWLPRNSADQARTVQPSLDLTGLDRTQKLIRLKQQGVPFLTLGWMPGHVVLYMGEKQGIPYLFNNLWGIKTVDPTTQQAGRALIGRSVIMPLNADAGYTNVPYTLLDRLQRLIVITADNYPLSKQPCYQQNRR
jgi:cell wall-associated NlpC family hydrolase